MIKPEDQNFALPTTEVSPSTAIRPQNTSDYDNTYKTAFPIDGLGGVHEDITKAAANKVGIDFSKNLERGVEWPDIPSEEPGKTSYMGLRNINKQGTLTYESHNGANQFWHSMTPSDAKYTNGQVLTKIVNQAGAWFDQAKADKTDFYIGNLLHMVQDSYSPAHVIRDENGAVVSFQAYDKQDHAKHKNGESKKLVDVESGPLGNEQGRMQSWQEVPGAIAAYRASVKILELYRDGASSDELKAFLRDDVYQFQNELTQSKPAGEIDPKYAPKPRTAIAENAETPMSEASQANVQFTSFGQMGASHAASLKMAEHIPEQYHSHLQDLVNQRIVEHNLTVGLLEKANIHESPTLSA